MNGRARTPPCIDHLFSIKIDNLPYRSNMGDVERYFKKYGKVGDIYIPRDSRTHESRGFAFVRYYYERDAEDAIHATDGSFMDGRELRVAMARNGRPTNNNSSSNNRRNSSSGNRNYNRDSGSRDYSSRGGDKGNYRESRNSRDSYRDNRDNYRENNRDSYRERRHSPPRRQNRDRSRSHSPRSRKRSRSPAAPPSPRYHRRLPSKSPRRSPLQDMGRGRSRSRSNSYHSLNHI